MQANKSKMSLPLSGLHDVKSKHLAGHAGAFIHDGQPVVPLN